MVWRSFYQQSRTLESKRYKNLSGPVKGAAIFYVEK
jgi:hypothetical protein